MAFIILGDQEQEWERRPLREAITIGRAFDCELPVRDTLLSRRHCRLEPHGSQWVLIDLKSRNGTRIGEALITKKVLEDGDVVKIGQTRLCFRTGPFLPAKFLSPIPSRIRPLDPLEAMAATLSGAALNAEGPEPHIPGFPTPKPKPAEPKSFQNDGVGVLVSKIASGVWDTRLANQALTRRPASAVPWPSESPPTAKAQAVKPRFARHDIEIPTERPARWLVMTYLIAAGAVFTTSLFAIAWPGI
jgi:hypothetical protein